MSNRGFSILIPTWNNLPYVKLCVESIRKNSSEPHQILLHVNEGADGTREWARSEGLEFTESDRNIGICVPVNRMFERATRDIIVYMNDDMYACPGWDSVLFDEIDALASDAFLLSSTMIEPVDMRNRCVVVRDFGTDLESFREQELVARHASLDKADWQGSTCPPVVLHRRYWEKVGGFSEEFSPGMYSDPDLSMKMWQAGCRLFKGVGKSKVYHFQCKSTGRVVKNDGKRQFLVKWGLLSSAFERYYLRRGEPFDGPLTEPGFSFPLAIARLRSKLKRGAISAARREELLRIPTLD